jgi:cellulose biosynthesis protein BcsQ
VTARWPRSCTHDGQPQLLCVPATIDLAGAEIELVSVVAREYRLRRAIETHLQELPPGAAARTT